MELKDLPTDIIYLIGHKLDTTSLLALASTSKNFRDQLSYKPLWIFRTKRLGFFQPSFDSLEINTIKKLIRAYMNILYHEVRQVCSQRVAESICQVMIDDDADQLEKNLQPSAHKSAKALMPIAIRFGRTNIMHSLFTHFNVTGRFEWLLHAIRDEQYAAVKYLIAIRKVPLITLEPHALLPVKDFTWDRNYKTQHQVGRNFATQFRHFNEIILHEILRCRHPKIVAYLKDQLNTLLSALETVHPYHSLFIKLRRHSLDGVEMKQHCDSPNFSRLLCR